MYTAPNGKLFSNINTLYEAEGQNVQLKTGPYDKYRMYMKKGAKVHAGQNAFL